MEKLPKILNLYSKICYNLCLATRNPMFMLFLPSEEDSGLEKSNF